LYLQQSLNRKKVKKEQILYYLYTGTLKKDSKKLFPNDRKINILTVSCSN
jgi:hypothetical protein